MHLNFICSILVTSVFSCRTSHLTANPTKPVGFIPDGDCRTMAEIYRQGLKMISKLQKYSCPGKSDYFNTEEFL